MYTFVLMLCCFIFINDYSLPDNVKSSIGNKFYFQFYLYSCLADNGKHNGRTVTNGRSCMYG